MAVGLRGFGFFGHRRRQVCKLDVVYGTCNLQRNCLGKISIVQVGPGSKSKEVHERYVRTLELMQLCLLVPKRIRTLISPTSSFFFPASSALSSFVVSAPFSVHGLGQGQAGERSKSLPHLWRAQCGPIRLLVLVVPMAAPYVVVLLGLGQNGPNFASLS